jgi:3-oxoacyl-[acyl-carrier protein] reductase
MTEAVAGDGAFVEIQGRKIQAGVNPVFAEAAAKTIPLGRPGTPDEAAGAIYLLCLPEADYINGQCVTVNGGKN